jgi:CO/xanthine dehydrogenase FAD-binding subunit
MSVLVATSIDEALATLATDPAAHVLAGGTDFMVEVNMGHRRPGAVVAIDRVPTLRGWRHDAATGHVTMGSGLTYAEMEAPSFAAMVPALAQAARTVGSPQIRVTGTLGGNLGTCSPAGDTLPVLAALDADLTLASATGRRTMTVHDFMVGVKRTALAPGELVVDVSVPVAAGWQGYAKVGVRNAMVIAIVSVCLAVDPQRRALRLAMGAVAPTVVRAREAEAWAAARVDWDRGRLDADPSEFGARAAAEARPIDDHRSTAAYRRHAVAVLAARLLRRALPSSPSSSSPPSSPTDSPRIRRTTEPPAEHRG